MVLCDQLEASLTLANATRRRLLDALLAVALAPVAEREMEGGCGMSRAPQRPMPCPVFASAFINAIE
jgi:hypothetical protein